jgi:hypothetical protein
VRETALSDNLLKFLHSGQNATDVNTAKTMGKMLESRDRLSLRSAANRTYQILVIRYTPQWYQFWRTSNQIRIVLSRGEQVTRAVLETADT